VASDVLLPLAANTAPVNRSSIDHPFPREVHMLVQVNTSNNTSGSAELTLRIETLLTAALDRFGERLTRVEVHLSDENGAKTRGDDKKCVLEARPASMQPMTVTHVAATFEQAVDGAAKKMERHLDDTFGRIQDRHRQGERGGA